MLEMLKDLKLYIIALLVGFFGPPILIVLAIHGNHLACKLNHCIIPYLG